MLKIVKSNTIPDELKMELMGLLLTVDQSFVPPLSARHPDMDRVQALEKHISPDTVCLYYFVFRASCLIGLAVIISDTVMDFAPNRVFTHLQLIAIHPIFQKLGIGKYIYNELIMDSNGQDLSTKTWSTNESHIKLAASFGLYECRRVLGARELGVDTVYLLQNTEPSDLEV
jgi:ribosomal protein S18 acetylase RimI-like enzyme